MQNKPNLPAPQMNVSSVLTKYYENKSNWKLGENKANTKPIQTQNKANQSQYKANQSQYKANTNPIPEKPKMKLNFYSTKDYENVRLSRRRENKPKQTQLVAA